MRRMAFSAAVLLAATCAAQAADCKLDRDLDTMAAAIASQPTCKKAARLAEDCAFGASGDVALQNAVIKVCEKDFLPGLDRRQRAAYRAQIYKCLHKYEHEQGTMYVSFSAFCQGGVAQKWSAKALR